MRWIHRPRNCASCCDGRGRRIAAPSRPARARGDRRGGSQRIGELPGLSCDGRASLRPLHEPLLRPSLPVQPIGQPLLHGIAVLLRRTNMPRFWRFMVVVLAIQHVALVAGAGFTFAGGGQSEALFTLDFVFILDIWPCRGRHALLRAPCDEDAYSRPGMSIGPRRGGGRIRRAPAPQPSVTATRPSWLWCFYEASRCRDGRPTP